MNRCTAEGENDGLVPTTIAVSAIEDRTSSSACSASERGMVTVAEEGRREGWPRGSSGGGQGDQANAGSCLNWKLFF